ncbi:22K [White sturgeon adenovirus 1]|uniref:22K n=1 Tax=White sturgeon adenovirus 1 TaxID=2580388 RepID=A0A4P8PIP3_9ADEN|nr:22K [White sturgeon adenovirus 1]QCQ84162.1 22K [White sturgeon adenovirus 1]
MTKLYDTPDEDEDEVSEGETLGSQDTEGSSEEEEEEFYQAPIRQRGTKAASKKKQTSMDSDCNSCRNRIAGKADTEETLPHLVTLKQYRSWKGSRDKIKYNAEIANGDLNLLKRLMREDHLPYQTLYYYCKRYGVKS